MLAGSRCDLKWLLIRVKEESDKAGLYLVPEKTEVMTTEGMHSSAKTETLMSLLTSVGSSVQMGTEPRHWRRLRLLSPGRCGWVEGLGEGCPQPPLPVTALTWVLGGEGGGWERTDDDVR